MSCSCKHYEYEIKEGKQVVEDLRNFFIKRMTVDSDHNDRRRKDFNQAIFFQFVENGEHEQVFSGTTMEMVLQCFDDAVKDWRRSWCDVDNCTRKE